MFDILLAHIAAIFFDNMTIKKKSEKLMQNATSFVFKAWAIMGKKQRYEMFEQHECV